MGHALMENRNGLIVGALATRASDHAERLTALQLMEPHADRAGRVMLGAGKVYNAQDFVAELREVNVTPHVAQNMSGRRSAIDGEPPTIPATPSVSASRKGSRRPSAGPSPWPGYARHVTAGCRRSSGSSPSRWRLTTSSACQSY
jgi:hypothetical protein